MLHFVVTSLLFIVLLEIIRSKSYQSTSNHILLNDVIMNSEQVFEANPDPTSITVPSKLPTAKDEVHTKSEQPFTSCQDALPVTNISPILHQTCEALPNNITLPSRLNTVVVDEFTLFKCPSFTDVLMFDSYYKRQNERLISRNTRLINIINQLNAFEETANSLLQQAQDHLRSMSENSAYREAIVADYFNEMNMSLSAKMYLEKFGWITVLDENINLYLAVKLPLKDEISIIRKLRSVLNELLSLTSSGMYQYESIVPKFQYAYSLFRLLGYFSSLFTNSKRWCLMDRIGVIPEYKKYYWKHLVSNDAYYVHCGNDLNERNLVNQLRKLLNPLYLLSGGHSDTVDSLLKDISELVKSNTNQESVFAMPSLKRAMDLFIDDIEINQSFQDIIVSFEKLYNSYTVSSTGKSEIKMDESIDISEYSMKLDTWHTGLSLLRSPDLFQFNLPLNADNFRDFYAFYQTAFSKMTNGRTWENLFYTESEMDTLKKQQKKAAKARAKKLRRRLRRKEKGKDIEVDELKIETEEEETLLEDEMVSDVEDEMMSVKEDEMMSVVQDEIALLKEDETASVIEDRFSSVIDVDEVQKKELRSHSELFAPNLELEHQFMKDRAMKLQLKAMKKLRPSATVIATENKPKSIIQFDNLTKEDCTAARAIYHGGNDLAWTQFVGFMEKLGAIRETRSYTAGSNQKFRFPGKQFPPINIHQPHPSNKFQKYQLHDMKYRFMKHLNLGYDSFAMCD